MCEGEDDGHIFGYSVIELLASTSIVHFVYVKHAYRKLGIAKMLINAYIPNFGETTTFISHAPRNLREASCKFKLTYNPYLMR
jgi:GNAT superfamily N-acetyltransferase